MTGTGEFIENLPFAPDDFQREAMEAIAEGHSVVVCAPTGSGKTIIAEYAATRAMGEGRKLFYTTPLKALSNQKFHDLKQQFGEANVGLLTGDTNVNRDARLVVMTTEIFRNMLYGTHEESRLLGEIGYVVLDECHFMNDAQRGTVWEESIIYAPESIQLIALSATIANAQELAAWINEIHHDTRLIWSDFRPVPLRFTYYDREKMMPLFEPGGEQGANRMNRKLKLEMRGNRFAKGRQFFRANPLIIQMHERAMLPAIFFTFSRKDCDRYLEQTASLRLLNDAERRMLNFEIDHYVAKHPFLKNNPALGYLRNGFASHHAGLLPALKHLSEVLFQQGLIKTVFATETLAAGINMPARSTVITKISKRSDDGHRLLTASEFLQMSGRAGRRGMDEIGYVIIVSSQYEGAREAATLAASPPDPLESRFTPTYGMVLNLLHRNTLAQAEFLISQSFGQFTTARRLAPIEAAIRTQSKELAELEGFPCPYGVSNVDFHRFLKSRALVQDTARFVRSLRRQSEQYGDDADLLAQLAHERAKLDNLRQTVDTVACKTCDILKQHQKSEETAHRLRKRLRSLDKAKAGEADTYWRQFMNIYQLLRTLGYIDAHDQPVGNGLLTMRIRAENELAITEVVTADGLLGELTAPQLAGVCCAMINDSTRDNLYTRLALSGAVNQVLAQVDKILKRVDRLQQQHHVRSPIVLNPIASPMVEAWAHGLDWQKLASTTNMGEGDLVRLMRRTADILRQLARVEGIPAPLKFKAKEALNLIDREPVREVEWQDAEWELPTPPEATDNISPA